MALSTLAYSDVSGLVRKMDVINKRILYLVSEDWYFCSHRLELATAALNQGFDVYVVTNVSNHAEIIKNAGLNLISINFDRSGSNPFKDLFLLLRLIKIYKRISPILVHHVSLKAVLIGSIAAVITKVSIKINALTGLGFVFSSDSFKANTLRLIITPVLKMFLDVRNCWNIFQNQDDYQHLIELGIVSRIHSVLIRGSGVNINKLLPGKEPPECTVMLASRMLIDKGVREFVSAAQMLKQKGINARFILVGDTDSKNPMSLSKSELLHWNEIGVVEWLGHVNDMPAMFAKVSIVCLPSYREGLPKVLLEAAACAKPMVATDVPGCREIVKHQKTGLLIPARDVEKLAEALHKLIGNKDLRFKLGQNGRRLVEQEFSMDIVNNKTLSLYKQALEESQIFTKGVRCEERGDKSEA